MKITNLRFLKVKGLIDVTLPLEEDGQVWALNVYDDHRRREISYPHQVGKDHPRPVENLFVLIDTDASITGQASVSATDARLIHGVMRRLLIGEDPIANERIWDILKRSTRIGHRGHWIVAMAAVDHALWDLRGKAANMPVHRLLGGPTRQRVPTYVSALGRSLEPEKVFAQAQAFKAQGFPGQKWFFKYGPGDGPEGMAKNLLLVRTLREAVGDDYPLMFDCFMGWDVLYSIEMCRRMERYNPHWLEEPLQPDRVQGYAEIRRKTSVAIAGGEHLSTRWDYVQMLQNDSLDVLQPDPYGIGGISEMIKIAALASAYDKIMCPHCGGVEFVASQPPSTCPYVEYLYTWWEMGQWFRQYPVQVEQGHVIPCEQRGLANDINWERVLSQEEWTPE